MQLRLAPRGERIGQGMRKADTAERHRHDHHQVGQAGNARMLGLEARHALAQGIQRPGVGTAACIDLARAAGQEDQRRHPHIAHADIDHRELPERGCVHIEHFAHRQHVGAAADPAARQRCHAGPGIAGHGGRMQPAHHPERHHRTQHDAQRCGQIHRDQLGAEPQDRAQVDAQGQQDQRGRQQHVTGDRVVQPCAGTVDQTGRVVDAWQQITQQQGRHQRVETPPEPLFARGCPEHRAQGGGDQAEHDNIVLNQRSTGSIHDRRISRKVAARARTGPRWPMPRI